MVAPTLVIVPGSFGTSDMYDPIVLPLRKNGYDIHVLDPPCYPKNYKAGSGSPAPSMYDDAKFVSDYVQKLGDEGLEVVLLGHSYGGKKHPPGARRELVHEADNYLDNRTSCH